MTDDLLNKKGEVIMELDEKHNETAEPDSAEAEDEAEDKKETD